MYNFEKIKKILSKRTLLYTYFIFFIILNVADFLSWLSADLDFFKKILSWILIFILFYQISFTKLFIGERVKKYDILYITSFSILIIPKLLNHYISLIANNLIFSLNDFYLFKIVIEFLLKVFSEYSQIGSLFLGIVILILTNISLLKNYNIKQDSFIGSLNLNSKTKMITSQISLLLLSFFFGFIIAPFFLEWFALSVDSIILVAGLIYYTVNFFYHHFANEKTSMLLRDISNTGSNFFKSIINSFSNKKTFFIGVSFLLTLHLLVDVGVYMIPYLFGTNSQLYFSSLGEETHTPLFNMFEFSNSQSYNEISSIFSEDNKSNLFLKLIQFIFVVLIYISTYIFFLFLLIFPFYYIYKRIHNKKINLSKPINFFILSMSFFYLMSILFLSNISIPLTITQTQDVNVLGVDIQTNSIFNGDLTQIEFSDTISVLILFIILTILILLFRFEKYKFFFERISFLIMLGFFIFYILTFYYDYNESFLTGGKKVQENENNLEKYIEFTNSKYFEYSKLTDELNIENEILIKGRIFEINGLDKNKNEVKYLFFSGNYELIKSKNQLVNNTNVLFYNEGNKEKIIIKFNEDIIQGYNQGKEEYLSNMSGDQTKTSFLNFINYINLFFSTIFYLIGIAIFSLHYIKTIFRKSEY